MICFRFRDLQETATYKEKKQRESFRIRTLRSRLCFSLSLSLCCDFTTTCVSFPSVLFVKHSQSDHVYFPCFLSRLIIHRLIRFDDVKYSFQASLLFRFFLARSSKNFLGPTVNKSPKCETKKQKPSPLGPRPNNKTQLSHSLDTCRGTWKK